MLSRFKNFLSNHRKSIIVISAGVMLLLLANLLNTDYTMKSGLRLLRYVSLLLISMPLFTLLIKGKKVVLGNLVLFFLLLLVTEITCFFMLGMPNAKNKNFSLPNLSENHIGTHMGSVPYADSLYHHVLKKGGDTVYDVTATIDKNCLRVTPDHSTENSKYALFFGCSIAYGAGLNDNQTLPYQFQENSKEFNAYNFAYSGYGTNHMLARLQYQDLSEQVLEKEGKAFYIFFWDHIKRAIGTMDRYCDWVSNAPYYTFEKDSLVRKKQFKNGRYLISKFYELVYQTNIVKKFKLEFPSSLNAYHFDLITEIILESKRAYQKQFGNNEFYVVFYPSYINYSPEQLSEFQQFLKTKNINYIDLSEFIEYGSKYTFDGDPHPNANTNTIISRELLNQINLK